MSSPSFILRDGLKRRRSETEVVVFQTLMMWKCPLGDRVTPAMVSLLALEELVRKAVDHAVHEDVVGLGGVNLLRPRASLVVLGCVPEGAVPVAHKEEHA